MKKIFALILSAVMLMCSASVFAETNVSVNFNGEKMTFDAEPFIENDRTLVPMRAIFEKAGATVTWDAETKTVIAAYESEGTQKFVILQINNASAFVNNEVRELDCPAKIVNDRTFVPLRFVMEELGCEVTWDEATYTVNINK